MTLQPIRGIFELTTRDALVAAGIAPELVFFDGVQETPPDAATAYAVVSLSFVQVAVETVGCAVEQIRGSLMCNVYTPKQRGSKQGEEIALAVLQSWTALNTAPQGGHCPRVQKMEGPRGIALSERPHQLHAVSCGFTAIHP